MTGQMNPVERLAALRMMQSGLASAITEATAQAEAYMAAVGMDRGRTPWGPVSITRRQPLIVITDEAGMLAWCEATYPHLVERHVSLERRRWLTGTALHVADGDVVHAETGEVVAWAEVRPAATGMMVRLTAEAKAEAAATVLARIDAVMAPPALPVPGEATP